MKGEKIEWVWLEFAMRAVPCAPLGTGSESDRTLLKNVT